jgi:hypothetical protein
MASAIVNSMRLNPAHCFDLLFMRYSPPSRVTRMARYSLSEVLRRKRVV